MPTLIEPTVPLAHSVQRHETEPSAALIGAHSEVAASVAEFDLDDSTLWQQVDSLVADTAGAAYALTEALIDEPAPRPARGVPPVVRVRELATAQRRLLAPLDRYPPPDDDVIDRGDPTRPCAQPGAAQRRTVADGFPRRTQTAVGRRARRAPAMTSLILGELPAQRRAEQMPAAEEHRRAAQVAHRTALQPSQGPEAPVVVATPTRRSRQHRRGLVSPCCPGGTSRSSLITT
jgi:hypothetical protein